MSPRSKPKWVPRCLEGGRKTGSLPVMGRRASRAPSATSTGWKPVCHDSRAGLSSALVRSLPHHAGPPPAAARFLECAFGDWFAIARGAHDPPAACRLRSRMGFQKSSVSLERWALRLVATQPRGDRNGRLPHRHFKLRTICRGSAVLVRNVALRATRSAKEK